MARLSRQSTTEHFGRGRGDGEREAAPRSSHTIHSSSPIKLPILLRKPILSPFCDCPLLVSTAPPSETGDEARVLDQRIDKNHWIHNFPCSSCLNVSKYLRCIKNHSPQHPIKPTTTLNTMPFGLSLINHIPISAVSDRCFMRLYHEIIGLYPGMSMGIGQLICMSASAFLGLNQRQVALQT